MASDEHSSTDGDVPARAVAAFVPAPLALEFLASGAGVEVDPAVMRRAVREARDANADAEPSDVLERAGAVVGLRVIARTRSVREVLSTGRSDRAGLVVEGPAGWALVLGWKG
jgi:hypothetical protein